MNYELTKLFLRYVSLKTDTIASHERFVSLDKLEKQMKKLAKELDKQLTTTT